MSAASTDFAWEPGISDYWLGLLTPFAIAATCYAALLAWVWIGSVLYRRGWRLEVKLRDLSNVSDFTLRRDIWWEQSFGCFFVGHWYFEDGVNGQPHINRWLGLGRPNGPVLMVLKVRTLPRNTHASTEATS